MASVAKQPSGKQSGLKDKVYASPDDVPLTVQIVNHDTWKRRQKIAADEDNITDQGTFSIVYSDGANSISVLNRYFARKKNMAQEAIAEATEDESFSATGLDYSYSYYNNRDRYSALLQEYVTPVFTEQPQSGAPPGKSIFWQHVFLSYKLLDDSGPVINVVTKPHFREEKERVKLAIREEGQFIVLYTAGVSDMEFHEAEKKYEPAKDDFNNASATRYHELYDYILVNGGPQNSGIIYCTEINGTAGNYNYEKAKRNYADFLLWSLHPSQIAADIEDVANSEAAQAAKRGVDFVFNGAKNAGQGILDGIKGFFNALTSWKGILLIFLALGGGLIVLILILKIIA